MKFRTFVAFAAMFALVACEYPYIFGNSINTKGIANGLGDQGIAGSQTTNWALDDVSQSVAYANGTNESNARTNGEGIWTPQLQGVNTNADAVNNGEGNALADSVSKSFNPYKQYWKENYASYINFLNSLFMKYPQKRQEIIKVVLKIAGDLEGDAKLFAEDAAELKLKLNINDDMMQGQGYGHHNHHGANVPKSNGYPTSIANYGNPDFESIGQTTFDLQRARGSGNQTAASTNSGTFRWNKATVHQGDATGNARKGWATSSSNSNGLGRVNYVNVEKNAGAYGDNAQTNSNSNQYLAKDAVWNNGDAWGRAEGDDSLAFSNLNGNSYGYGAVEGDTNAYTDGDLSVSKSQVKGAPYLGKKAQHNHAIIGGQL